MLEGFVGGEKFKEGLSVSLMSCSMNVVVFDLEMTCQCQNNCSIFWFAPFN